MSEFSSTLAALDGRLQAVRAQVDALRAALEFDDGRLSQDLALARGQGAMLRDLIRVERPDAQWTSRAELNQLLADIAAAHAARLNQQRRNRLLGLANELDAGTVKHRFEARASALNALRLAASKELRAQADSAGDIKELPGPGAVEWLPWVCNLQEEQDAANLADLHRDFPALERFAGEMEESYWFSPNIPAQQPAEPPPPAEKPAVTSTSSPEPPPAFAANQARLPQNLRAQFDQAMSDGNYSEAVSLCYGNPPTEAPVREDTSWPPSFANEPPTATSTAVSSAMRTPAAASVVRLKYCEKCGSSYSSDFHECQYDDSVRNPAPEGASRSKTRGIHLVLDYAGDRSNGNGAASETVAKSALQMGMMSASGSTAVDLSEDAPSEAAGAEFERLRAIVGTKAADGENPDLAEEEGNEEDPRKKRFIVRVIVASGIMLLVLATVIFFFTARLGPRSDKPVTEAVKLSSQVRDSNIQKDIERRLAVLKDSSIQVTVHDGAATLGGQAASSTDAAQAAALAAQVNGVKSITNNIRVEMKNAARQ